MTAKDYTQIADALAQVNPVSWKNEHANDAWLNTVAHLAGVFEQRDEKFNAKRFITRATRGYEVDA